MAGQTEPLIAAVKAGNVGVATQLANSINASLKDADGTPVICLAVEGGHNEIVKAILLRGASPEEQDAGGRNCIHIAAAEGNVEAIKTICTVEGGLELELATKAGNTALHRAAAYGQLACVSYLLEQGARHDAVNGEGMTPLIRAARWGHADVAGCLLKAGASYTAKDTEQRTALAWSRSKGFEEVEGILLNPPQAPLQGDSDEEEEDEGGEVEGQVDFFSAEASGAAAGNGTFSVASTAAQMAGGRRSSVVAAAGAKFGEPMRVEGWMRKHGGTFRPWRNRFFVLEGRTVWYYGKEGQAKEKAKGVVRMVRGTEVVVEDSYSKPHCFNINTPARKYVVQTSNEEEMAEWMEALQNNLDVCPPEMALEEWDDVQG